MWIKFVVFNTCIRPYPSYSSHACQCNNNIPNMLQSIQPTLLDLTLIHTKVYVMAVSPNIFYLLCWTWNSTVVLHNTLQWYYTIPYGGTTQYPIILLHNTLWWYFTIPYCGTTQYPMVVLNNTLLWYCTIPYGGTAQYSMVVLHNTLSFCIH